jgi:hypothetical protein
MTTPDLSGFVGAWVGHWRTWVEPDVLHDESPITGEIRSLLDGRDLLFTYEAAIGGDPVGGTALIGSRQGGGCTIAWIDSWHTSGLMLTSHGLWVEGAADAETTYEAEGQVWTWSTRFAVEAGRLVVRHWNAGPGVPRYLGVEAVLSRA